MSHNFFEYQIQRFGLLLGWGSGNVLAGALLSLLRPRPRARYFWLMNASWGLINALLALAGQSGARSRLRKPAADDATLKREAGKMQRLLLVNVPLDVLYVVSGVWMACKKDHKWQGMGQSVIIQGVWLFFYDSLLAREVGRRWQK